jgi:ABC-type multidrug transport system fused ATPase/permease subunit
LEAVGLSYRYPESPENAVTNLNIALRPGKVVVLAGAVGSGKSTVLKLLAGLLVPCTGSIKIKGIPEKDLRKRLGYVPQEPVTFSTSVEDNLRLGREEITSDRLAEAARLSCIDDEVRAMPHSYATCAGPRGVTLSGGQKQRLALARAYAGSPDILLLDDPVSSLDGQTEKAVWENVRCAARSSVCLVATHSRTILESADRIIVLERGSVVEEGTHRDLIARRGAYHEIYRRQLLKEADLLDNK